jgi:hypothetical protein
LTFIDYDEVPVPLKELPIIRGTLGYLKDLLILAGAAAGIDCGA